MINFILYNYGLNIDNLYSQDSNYYFYINGEKFILTICSKDEKELKELNNLIIYNKIESSQIIINRFGNFLVFYNQVGYVLIKSGASKNDYLTIEDITFSQKTNSNSILLLRNNWSELWSKKVDYLEYQVSELGKDHKTVLSSFSYYLGLAENAISYFNMLNLENVPLYVQRKRILYPCSKETYNNPLNLVIDYKIRSISEYIKSYFFNDTLEDQNIDYIFTLNYSPIEYNLLFVRLLYISCYFDDLERVLENKEDDDILLKYIEKATEYEKFLVKMHKKIAQHTTIMKIDWLK